ncbi:Satratoxin biosynthesis SC1 cluster protein 4 [Colletotrichum aenigma]|uniref:Satratoxin biosynthesis SC1 cluster protein 4 n=1 Tax=Colletotrichum aenigma TaxID=1215731 RepID=UPI001872796D|nr:Satratoxin biosynthesis SC1 cluster protein 4 [Colletotrichum aenigma]KAF5502486.1 Satratoxin biosynthesis SC1 cluster protein 4 [Colletotrichum aenigma]
MRASLVSLLVLAGVVRLVSGSAFTDALGAAPQCAVRYMRSQGSASVTLHHRQHDMSVTARYTLIFLLILPISFFAARMIARGLHLTTWGAEDTTIVLAFIFFLPFVPITFVNIFKLHPYQITMFLKLLFVLQLFYILDLAVIKASIICLYLRVFSISLFRTVLWCTQGFNFLLGFSYVLLSLLQCQPLNHYWNGWDGRHPGKCADLNLIGLTHVALNIGLDVWVLILPASQVYKLNLPLKKKLGVMAMFGVGVFLTIVSIIRIKSLLVFATSFNITAETLWGIIWSYVELCVGISVACMPAARQLAVKFFPKLIDLTRQSLTRSTRSARSTQNTNTELRPVSNSRRSMKSDNTGVSILQPDTRSLTDTNTPKSATFTIGGSRQQK